MMKNHFLIYIIFALILASCKQSEPMYSVHGGPCDLPETAILVLKYPQQEMLNYVMATQLKNDSTSLCLSYGDFYPAKYASALRQAIPLEGTKPYIPLTNDYYMIDWKWYFFFPLTHYEDESYPFELPCIIQHLICPRSCFLNIKWQDLEDITDTFDMSMKLADLELSELIVVPYHTLDKLYQEEKECEYYYWNLTTASLAHWRDTLNETDYAHIHSCDSFQTVCQQRLIEVINNGQLLNIGYKCH